MEEKKLELALARVELALARVEDSLTGIESRLKRVELLCSPQEERVAHVVENVSRMCSPEVVRIRWTIGKDLTNTEALKLRVVVEKPADVWGKGKLAIHEIGKRLCALNVSLFVHAQFRTAAEQDIIQDEDWK